jgi:MYXO-CTERM domain-containing protein
MIHWMPLSSAAWMEIVAGLVALAVVALFGRQRRTRLDKTDLGTVSGQWIAEHRSQAGR